MRKTATCLVGIIGVGMFLGSRAAGAQQEVPDLTRGGRPVNLLPALPKAWPTGAVKGLRARGGFEVDIVWKNGNLEAAVVRSISGGACVVRHGEKTTRVVIPAGTSITLTDAQWK